MTAPLYWREAAQEVLDSLHPFQTVADLGLEDHLKGAWEVHDSHPDWSRRLVGRAASLAWLELVDSGRWNETEFLDMLCARQAKYGPENIKRTGFHGVLVRLQDKAARLENLRKNRGTADFSDESYVDTLHDIIGYYIVSRMADDGTIELPLQLQLTTVPATYDGVVVKNHDYTADLPPHTDEDDQA